MAKTVEIFYAIQNGRPSIRFHVTDIVEGNAKEKILEMLNDLPIPESVVNSLKDPLSVPILPTAVKDEEVQDVPCALPPAQEEAPPSNNVCPEPQENASEQKKKTRSSSRAKITLPQIATIRQGLQERRIPEFVFCMNNHVERIEDLPGGVAWHIIHDHNY